MRLFLLIILSCYEDVTADPDEIHDILRYRKHIPQVILANGGRRYYRRSQMKVNSALLRHDDRGYFMKDGVGERVGAANKMVPRLSAVHLQNVPPSPYFVHQGTQGQHSPILRKKRDVSSSESDHKKHHKKRKHNHSEENSGEKSKRKGKKKHTKKKKSDYKKTKHSKKSKKSKSKAYRRFGNLGKFANKRVQIITKATHDQNLTNQILKNVSTVLARRNAYDEDKGAAVQTRRLITANDALIRDYPYVVAILKGGEVWCGGALLNERIVISTANCFWKSAGYSRMLVRACSEYADRGGQVAGIQQVVKHSHWDLLSWLPDHDVALVQLDKNIKFSHTCHGADLPRHYMRPGFNEAWVTGWGSERRDGVFENKQPQTLQVYQAYFMSQPRCRRVMARHGVNVTNNFLCLKQLGYRAPCTRDTGSPAVSEGVVWGLASWGLRKACGTRRFPAMFTYLGSESIQDFITMATARLMSEARHSPFLERPHDPITSLSAVTLADPMSPRTTDKDYSSSHERK